MDYQIEKRRHQRLYFSSDDKIEALLTINDTGLKVGAVILATVLNLSESGIGLSILRNQTRSLKTDERLFLIQIYDLVDFRLDFIIELKIKWLLDNQALEHVVLGCEFLDMPESSKQLIRNYVLTGRK
jgi:c-di-GMP-binding flagellar brake protein YcgR